MPIFNVKVKFSHDDFLVVCKVAVSLTITVIAILIVAWYLSNKYRGYSIQNQNTGPQISNNNTNPFSQGLQPAGLGQVSTFVEDTAAVPNNPSSIQSLACAPGMVAVNEIISGAKICLADYDSPCRTVSDCRPEAITCINNVCSVLSNINQPCNSDTDCWYFNNERVNNYVCSQGFCKVPLFPQAAGCNYDSDCDNSEGLLGNTFCLQSPGDPIVSFQNSLLTFNVNINSNIAYFTSIDTGVNHNFWTIGTQILLFDETMTSIITENYINQGLINNGVILYTGIINGTSSGAFNVIELTDAPTGSKSILNFLSSQGLVSFGGYPNSVNTIEGGYVGICTEKLPLGAPSNITIGGFTIPCEDQYISMNNKCVQAGWTGQIGQVCLTQSDDLACADSTLAIPVGCAYDYTITSLALDSFLYNYNPQDYNIYQIGTCSYEVSTLGNTCNIPSSGCSLPYICLPSLTGSNNITMVCLQPLDIMYCDQGYICPKEYVCSNETTNLGVQIPICYGQQNAICYQNQDCFNNNCDSNNLYLNMFSMDLGKYINITILNGESIANISDYKVLLSPNYTTVKNFSGIEISQTMMPSSLIITNVSPNYAITVYLYVLNTTIGNYEFSKSFVVQNQQTTLDTQTLITENGNIAFFSGYANHTTPETGYYITNLEESDDGYLVLITENYNIFSTNDIDITYYAYIYVPVLSISNQQNLVLTVQPAGANNFKTDILYANYNTILDVFSVQVTAENATYLMVSAYAPQNNTSVYTYQKPPGITDSFFHVPAVYKFDSFDVNSRNLVLGPIFSNGDQITDSTDNIYYLEELYLDDNGLNYFFNLHSDYFAAEGDVVIENSNNNLTKFFNMSDSTINFDGMFFGVNINTKVYCMYIIDPADLTNNDGINLSGQEDYVFNKSSINGINGSISYVFDTNIDVNITMESNNNLNYIYFKCDIAQQTLEGTSITNTYIQKAEYINNGTSVYSENYQNYYSSGYNINLENSATDYYFFNYTNSFAIPRTKTTPKTGTFVDSVAETFFDNQTDSIQFMTTFKNGESGSNAPIAGFSRFNDVQYIQDEGNIGANYTNYNVFQSQQFQPYTIETNISLNSSSTGNRVDDGGLTITFTDSNVIETILSFPSSEIVLTNNGSTLQEFFISGNGVSSIYSAAKKEFPNNTFNLPTNVSEYTSKNTEIVRTISVSSYDPETETLTVNLNAPIDVNNAYIQDVFNNTTTKPQLWLNNFVPITYLSGENRWFYSTIDSTTANISTGSADGEVNLFTILDGSTIFGGTKSSLYDLNNLSRTSYNKIVYYDNSNYNTFMVRDNYFNIISGGYDSTPPIDNSNVYYGNLDNRKNESIFTSNALSAYTQPEKTTITGNNPYKLNTGLFQNTTNFSINSTNDIVSSLMTISDYESSSKLSTLISNYITSGADSSFTDNESILSLLKFSTVAKHNFLNNVNYNNSYNTAATSSNEQVKSYFALNSSRIFYSTGLLNNLEGNTTLPSKIPVFEINNNQIFFSSSASSPILIDENLPGYTGFTGPAGDISSILSIYNPNSLVYNNYQTNNPVNSVFCYFKRKYLLPRLLDSALSLTNFGDNILISTDGNYEIFPLGNNDNSNNYIIDNFGLTPFESINTIINGSYQFNGSQTYNQTYNQASISMYTKQPIESFTTTGKISIPNVVMQSQDISFIGFLMTNLDVQAAQLLQYGLVTKTYIDTYMDFLFVKYNFNTPSKQTTDWYTNLVSFSQSFYANSFGAQIESYVNGSDFIEDLTFYTGAFVAYLEIRPPYSATINLPLNNQMTQDKNLNLYAVNNMFLTSIERPLFKYNNRNIIPSVYIINSFTLNDTTYYRMTGQINFPINTSPVVISSNINYNLANYEIINFPTHFTERFVSSDIDNFIIDTVYASNKFGNNFANIRYYVVGHYLDIENNNTSNYQLLYLATSGEKMLLSSDRGIPTSLTFLNSANTLNLKNTIAYEPFNNLIMTLTGKCLS